MNTRDMHPHPTPAAENKSRALRVAANAVFRHLIDPVVKGHILALVRACAGERVSAEAHKTALAKEAGLIPGFAVFRQLCMEDLAEAYHEDRSHFTHVTRNRKRVWMNMFKPFARLNRITQALEIAAVDHQGHYRCELVEPRAPDHLAQWLRLGARLGMKEADLLALIERQEQAGERRAINEARVRPVAN